MLNLWNIKKYSKIFAKPGHEKFNIRKHINNNHLRHFKIYREEKIEKQFSSICYWCDRKDLIAIVKSGLKTKTKFI